MTMAEAILETEKCDECGVDVRDGTTFCYNCGARVVPEESTTDGVIKATDESVVDDPDVPDKDQSPDETEKLAAAATKRKSARVSHRKAAEYVWEPTAGDGARRTLLVAVLIGVFALAVVVLMLDW